MQQNMQSRQDFNRMTNQQSQDFNAQMMARSQNRMRLDGRPATPEERAKSLAKQQQLEQEATEKLARLAQEQQQRRQAHPAKNQCQAAAQLKADNKQLNQLAVKNYQEIFLKGQVLKELADRQASGNTERGLRDLSKNLQSDAWWSKLDGTQATGAVKAYGDSLTLFANSLLGFDLASPPAIPAPFSARALNEQLQKDTFDQNAATQLVQHAALTERLLASEQLAQSVKEFAALSTTPDFAQQSDAKKMRKEVQKSLRSVNKALAQYHSRISSSDKMLLVAQALYDSTSAYLAKNGK